MLHLLLLQISLVNARPHEKRRTHLNLDKRSVQEALVAGDSVTRKLGRAAPIP